LPIAIVPFCDGVALTKLYDIVPVDDNTRELVPKLVKLPLKGYHKVGDGNPDGFEG
jgi:hypothetical protein